jgi:hypothetical protein
MKSENQPIIFDLTVRIYTPEEVDGLLKHLLGKWVLARASVPEQDKDYVGPLTRQKGDYVVMDQKRTGSRINITANVTGRSPKYDSVSVQFLEASR